MRLKNRDTPSTFAMPNHRLATSSCCGAAVLFGKHMPKSVAAELDRIEYLLATYAVIPVLGKLDFFFYWLQVALHAELFLILREHHNVLRPFHHVGDLVCPGGQDLIADEGFLAQDNFPGASEAGRLLRPQEQPDSQKR